MTRRMQSPARAGWMGIAAVVLALVALPACSNKLSGEATVDGKAFVPDTRRSGQRWGAAGVEIEAKDGRRLRAAQTVDGGGMIVVFAPGADRGTTLGACADLKVEKQNSTINSITNVQGKIALHCQTDRGTAS